MDYLCEDAPEPIILTGAITLDPKWKSRVLAPSAPSNYKDESKIADYVEKKIATLENDALYCASLVNVSNVRAFVHNGWYTVMSDKNLTHILEIAGAFKFPIIGDNAELILRSLYIHSELYREASSNKVRRMLIDGAFVFRNLRSVLYTPMEKKIVFDPKFSKKDGEEEHEWIIRVIEEIGWFDKSDWNTVT